jgi:predicted nucleotidyltransferase
MTTPSASPNRRFLLAVAHAVRPMLQELTFVGGQVAELLVTDPLNVRIRYTDDVDAVVGVTSRSEYARLEDRLRSLGLRHDTSEGAPLCRWLTPDHVKLDVMPVEGQVLQFSNRWYAEAVTSAHLMTIETELTIRVVSAPVFLATKWEAYADRGQKDLLGSHDIEDIITVIAGRETIVGEIEGAPQAVREWLAMLTRDFLANAIADYAIEGALPDARFDQTIITLARSRLAAIAEL